MKFKDFVEAVNKLLADNPAAGEFNTIYSGDDEGNYFQEVFYDPGPVRVEDGEADPDGEPNAICIN